MNLILKIVQGPNTGAEIALIEGINVKLGKGDDCDIVIRDQTLPDVACELEVGAERVMLLLPGGGQERLEPLHVKMFETTAIAIGPADEPWGKLIWPVPEEEEPQPEEPAPEEKKPEQDPRARRLQLICLAVLVLFVILEFVVWFFWPAVNTVITKSRNYLQAKYALWKNHGVAPKAIARYVDNEALPLLAKEYQVEFVMPAAGSEEKPILRGNLKTRSEKMQLTAAAYSAYPEVNLELSDDESLRNASTELLNMLAPDALHLDEAENRRLSISGRLGSVEELQRVLVALKNDVPYLDDVDCSKIVIPAPITTAGAVIQTNPEENAEEQPVHLTIPNFPVVGLLTVPYPCLVLRDGSRIVEGAEFNGYIVSKISEEAVLLKHGDTTLEWRL